MTKPLAERLAECGIKEPVWGPDPAKNVLLLYAIIETLMDQRDELLSCVKWASQQQNLFFAECSQAEEIIQRCQKALAAVTNQEKKP